MILAVGRAGGSETERLPNCAILRKATFRVGLMRPPCLRSRRSLPSHHALGLCSWYFGRLLCDKGKGVESHDKEGNGTKNRVTIVTHGVCFLCAVCEDLSRGHDERCLCMHTASKCFHCRVLLPSGSRFEAQVQAKCNY